MKDIYIKYCANHPRAVEVLTKYGYVYDGYVTMVTSALLIIQYMYVDYMYSWNQTCGPVVQTKQWQLFGLVKTGDKTLRIFCRF